MTHVQSSSTGFLRSAHNFVMPVEQYLRDRPITISLADAFAWHAAAESKRPVRCIADMLGAHMTPRNRTNPLLRKRQTLDAIV
jgi:hypothetical protein